MNFADHCEYKNKFSPSPKRQFLINALNVGLSNCIDIFFYYFLEYRPTYYYNSICNDSFMNKRLGPNWEWFDNGGPKWAVICIGIVIRE